MANPIWERIGEHGEVGFIEIRETCGLHCVKRAPANALPTQTQQGSDEMTGLVVSLWHMAAAVK